MNGSDSPRELARCVAITQVHRGHGASTAAYYLARVLVSEGLRVLLVDLTGRRQHLTTLVGRAPTKNLGLWSPSLPKPADLGTTLERAKRQTTGKVDVLLLDVDAALLESANALQAGIDHVLVVSEMTDEGQAGVDRLAERLGDELPPFGKVSAVFSRLDAPMAEDLPEKTEDRSVPVLGYYPADYLLAAGDEYSLKGGEPAWPHDKYLYALLRVGRALMRTVPLHRIHLTTGMAHHDVPSPPLAGADAISRPAATA